MVEKHKAVLMGNIIEKRYKVDRYVDKDYYHWAKNYRKIFLNEPEIVHEYILVGHEEFLKFELDRPLLEIDENLYIAELGKTVLVKKRARSTTGEIVYFVDHDIKVLEDGKDTGASLVIAHKELEEAQKEYKKFIDSIKETEEAQARITVKQKPWYLRIFE